MTAEETPDFKSDVATGEAADLPSDVTDEETPDVPADVTADETAESSSDDADEEPAESADDAADDVSDEESADDGAEEEDEVEEEAPELPADVLEAGSALGEPVPTEPDPRLRVLSGALIVNAVLLFAAVATLGILFNKNTGLLIACGVVIAVLCAVAGALLRLIGKLRTPAVVLFEDGFVHATSGEPVAVPWSDVKVAYLTPGKLMILQLETGPDFVLRAPVSNLAKIEAAVRKGVPRDRVRRGLPPKNLAAV